MRRRGKRGWWRVVAREKIGTWSESAMWRGAVWCGAVRCGAVAAGREGPGREGVAFITRARVSRL